MHLGGFLNEQTLPVYCTYSHRHNSHKKIWKLSITTEANNKQSTLIPISCGPQLISGLWLLPCTIALGKASGISSCFKIFFLALPNRSKTQDQLWHLYRFHCIDSYIERCKWSFVTPTRNKSSKDIPLPFSDLKISGSSLWISSKCFVKWLGVLKSVMHMGHINPSKTSPLPAISGPR